MTYREREEEGNSSNTKIVEIKNENVEEEQDRAFNELLRDFDLNFPEPEINEVEDADTLDEQLNEFDLNFPLPQINEEEGKENPDTMEELLNEFAFNFPELINEVEEENADTLDEELNEFDFNFPEPEINEEEEKEDADRMDELLLNDFHLNFPEPEINEEEEKEDVDRMDELLNDFDFNFPEPEMNEEEEKEDADRMNELLNNFDLHFPEPEINEEEEKEDADRIDELLNDFRLNFPEPEINEEDEKEDTDSLDELLKDFDLRYQELFGIDKESERSTKRTRTTESTIKNTAVNLEAHETERGMDPLEVIEEIVVKYHDFIHEIYQMLKDEQKKEQIKDEQKKEQIKDEQREDERKKVKMQWQKWKEILERASLLVEDVNQGLRTVALEMEWMRSIDELKKEYSLRESHVPDLIALLRDINTRIESSPNFRVVSDVKNRDEVLTMCLYELERSKEELNEMVEVIHELKEMDLQDDANVQDAELDLELDLEGDEFEELNLVVDEQT